MTYKERQAHAKKFNLDEKVLGKTREDWITQFLEVIIKEDIWGMEELISHFPFSKSWFYYNNFHDLDVIKSAIDKNKTKIKTTMLKKWSENYNNASLQFGAYKILGNREERLILSNSSEMPEEKEVRHDKIDLSKLSDDELRLFIELQEKAKE